MWFKLGRLASQLAAVSSHTVDANFPRKEWFGQFAILVVHNQDLNGLIMVEEATLDFDIKRY